MKKTTEFQKIDELINRVNTINIIERIFAWKDVKNLSLEAAKELGSIDKITESEIQEALQELKQEKAKLESKLDSLNRTNLDNTKKITEFETNNKKEQEEYTKRIDQLNKLEEKLNQDRQKLQKEREEEIAEHFEKQKETWKLHEKAVEDKLKLICERNHLEYISKDKVAFKGKPDNTIKIGDQYIIFDAKSPQSNNLESFPKYVRDQAKTIEKYINEKDVRKSIYLVVPHNTIDVIKENLIKVSNYKVYIVSIDSLEPIIESLQEILNYKYTDKLSPEQRDKIAEIIGRFTHSTKRRIQIENYMNNYFLSIVDDCNDLDENIKIKAEDMEKSYTLNPDMDKKGKLIDINKLEEEIKILGYKIELKDKKLLDKKKK